MLPLTILNDGVPKMALPGNRASLTPDRVLFGAAYYAEYQPTNRLETDLDLMAEAKFSVIRVGESEWSTWEPRDGEFDLEWLQPVLDGAHERGISVILGTPTYAVPPWLQESHPEIAAEVKSGQPMAWGSRQEVDYTHPAFLFHAERVIRRIVERYADHPAVIGYQADNQPGLLLFHNPSTFRRFVRRLKKRCGTVEELNARWGLTYWSHRIADWSELWTPDGNTQPQYDLAWRQYQAELTTEFIAWQAEIVRQYSTDDHFVTTCIAYSRPALDDESLMKALDITAGNPYYGMQDHLSLGHDTPLPTPWASTGVPGLFRQADRLFSSKQSRFLVTETNAWSIGGAAQNYPPCPGQLKQAAFALISRGAAQIEYWHWHTLHFGTETYWGGVLPHSQIPGRVFREVAEIGAALESFGTRLEGYQPDADVAILWSTDTRFAFDFTLPLNVDGGDGRHNSYSRIVDAFHSGVIQTGAQARILHTGQALSYGAEDLARRFPVLIAPALYVATDDELTLLADYARAGGHVVIGIRTGYADEEARARPAVAPDHLHEAARVWYEEFSNLDDYLEVRGHGELHLSPEARATDWADGLIVGAADVLATYAHPEFERFPAITTATAGSGRVTYVGTVPNTALAADSIRFVVSQTIGGDWITGEAVTIASGTLPDGARVWFVHNWSSRPSSVTVPTPMTDLSVPRSAAHPAGTEISLEPWSSMALVDGFEGGHCRHSPPHELLIGEASQQRSYRHSLDLCALLPVPAGMAADRIHEKQWGPLHQLRFLVRQEFQPFSKYPGCLQRLGGHLLALGTQHGSLRRSQRNRCVSARNHVGLRVREIRLPRR